MSKVYRATTSGHAVDWRHAVMCPNQVDRFDHCRSSLDVSAAVNQIVFVNYPSISIFIPKKNVFPSFVYFNFIDCECIEFEIIRWNSIGNSQLNSTCSYARARVEYRRI